MPPPEVFIATGEVSGDLHGGALLEGLRRRCPGIRAFGIGGPRLEAAGLEKLAGIEELSLVGISEVLHRLPAIYRLLGRMKDALERRRPRAVVLVDSPDFNLRLAAHARRLGLKVVYYIGPTVWAWRRGRVAAVRESVDLMLTILPFEEEIYRREGVRSLYVGNPLVDDAATPDPEAFLRGIGADRGAVLFSLLPGSRTNEVRRLMPVLAGAAHILRRRFPDLHFLVPAASPVLAEEIRGIIGDRLAPCTVVSGQAAQCLAVSRAAVVTSGTATLQAALQDTPFVTVYRLAPFSYLVGRLFVKTPWISLPNIIAGEPVVEELIQARCRPEETAAAATSSSATTSRAGSRPSEG